MRIAVAGGAGSIGSELVRQLWLMGHELCVFDFDEYGLYKLAVEMHGLKLICGDVRSADDLRPVGHWQPDVIYNCAALKHITFCEDNPSVAYEVNSEGNWQLLQIARVILLSTDKAVEPSSELGKSKQAAEEAVIACCGGVVVRLCNVWDTRGNFFETAAAQVAAGKHITITDPRVTRWYMPKDEAVAVLIAALDEPDGSLLVPTEPSVELVNIADRIAALYPGWPVIEVGLREGEKLHESMAWPSEEPIRTSGRPAYAVLTSAPALSATETAGP